MNLKGIVIVVEGVIEDGDNSVLCKMGVPYGINNEKFYAQLIYDIGDNIKDRLKEREEEEHEKKLRRTD